jgi:hypothetical protein
MNASPIEPVVRDVCAHLAAMAHLTHQERLAAAIISIKQLTGHEPSIHAVRAAVFSRSAIHHLGGAARGWPRRDRIDMVRRASTKHGRAGRAQAREYGPDYAAYRRQQRKRSGYLRDVRCEATNKNGEPCKRFALAERAHCVTHDPQRAQERQRIMQAAWKASRARMLRWGDHRAAIEQAIAAHGRPALCRSSGICTTVLGKMLGYDDEQAIKPETWRKLRAGIEALATSRASERGLTGALQ